MDNNNVEHVNTAFSIDLTLTLERAKKHVIARGGNYVDLVFALYGLLDERKVINALSAKGIDILLLRNYLERHLEKRKAAVEDAGEGCGSSSQINISLMLHDACLRVLKNKGYVDTLDLLNAIWLTPPSPLPEYYAVTAIERCLVQSLESVRRCDRTSFIFDEGSFFLPRDADARIIGDPVPDTDEHAVDEEQTETTRRFTNIMFCTNLTAQAFSGKTDPIFGRDQEVSRMAEIITRRKKNNPILLGEPGVGKTAIVEALAARIIEGNVPKQLISSEIVALDIARFVAGTNHRGDFEQRITNLVETLEEHPHLILFIDEIHALVGGTLGAADAAELLKPALSSGRIRVIGATTHGEYLKYFGRNPAMARRFQPIAVAEPNVDDAIMIIDKVVPTYAEFHKIEYCENAAQLAVELSKAFIVDKQLPDKAIDVIDEAGSYAAAAGREAVEEADIYTVVQRMSGIKIAANEGFGSTVLEDLRERILGQDKACEQIARALARASSGLTREDRAKASILLFGPDASGKRYAAKQIAGILNAKMIRLDMSEFSDSHSTSRLIGAPPGYIGYGEGGQLSEAVRRNPSSVIFLDRIELAHPNVISIILQAIETGSITDSMGNLVSFTGTTVVMSAIHENHRHPIGFANVQADEGSDEQPENLPSGILEAVDVAVQLIKMPEKALEALAGKYLSDMATRLGKRGVAVKFNGDISGILTAQAKEDSSTAKAVERAFRKLIEDPVLDALPRRGQTVVVSRQRQETVVVVIQ